MIYKPDPSHIISGTCKCCEARIYLEGQTYQDGLADLRRELEAEKTRAEKAERQRDEYKGYLAQLRALEEVARAATEMIDVVDNATGADDWSTSELRVALAALDKPSAIHCHNPSCEVPVGAIDKTAQPPIKRCPRCGGELYGTSSAMGGPTEWLVCRCGYEEEVIHAT